MGAPSKTLIESLTDKIAAVVQEELDGAKAEYDGATVNTLYDLLDASGDPAVETALGTVSLAIDEQSLPARYYEVLDSVKGRPALSAWCTALKNLVTSASGGGYANLAAYLTAVSAKLHPLFAEIYRRAIGDDFTSSGDVIGVSVPAYTCIFPSRVYAGADGSLAEETTDATDVGTADITLFGSDNHALYIGSDRPFSAVIIALSTLANTSITPTFQYWNGSSWATLSVTDNTGGLTENEAITWTIPTDWTRYNKDSGGTAFTDKTRLYYIRIARTADTVGTPPVGTCITLVPQYTPASSGSSLHLGTPQPPLALIRVTAANTATTTFPANIDYTRFSEPLTAEGKIRIRALTPFANNVTVTITYTKQDGTAGAAIAQSAMTTPAALDTLVVSLNGTDGIRAVTAISVTTDETAGVLEVGVDPIRTPAI